MKTAKKDGQFPVTVSENRVTAKIHKVAKSKNGKTYMVWGQILWRMTATEM